MSRVTLFLAMGSILTIGCSSTELFKSTMPMKIVVDYLRGHALPDRRLILKIKISW